MTDSKRFSKLQLPYVSYFSIMYVFILCEVNTRQIKGYIQYIIRVFDGYNSSFWYFFYFNWRAKTVRQMLILSSVLNEATVI